MLRNCLFIFSMFCASVYSPPKQLSEKSYTEKFTPAQFDLLENIDAHHVLYYTDHTLEERKSYFKIGNTLLGNRAARGEVGNKIDSIPVIWTKEFEDMEEDFPPKPYILICTSLYRMKNNYDKMSSEERDMVKEAIDAKRNQNSKK